MSAVGADGVGQAHGSAVGAQGEVAGLQGIVGAAVVAASLRVFAFWMWGHSTFSLFLHIERVDSCPPLRVLRSSGGIIAGGGRGVKCRAGI